MASYIASLCRSSVFRKQLVAVTGIAMVGFLLGHLVGNLLILVGPEAFNGYAAMLASIPELLWVARVGLIVSLILHVYFTVMLTIENRAARGSRYAVQKSKGDAFVARKFMVLTGGLVFFFLFLHLRDFTLGDKVGDPSVIPGVNNNESLGLFGLVWNSFLQAPRSILYILAVSCVGLHFSHGVQSLFQTLGLNHDRYTPTIEKLSLGLGAAIAVGFSIIPLYVLITRVPSL